MSLPILQYRKDVVVMVAWDPSTPSIFTNWCGATGITLAINNAISETTSGDCDDWTLPPETIAAYGAQTVTSTVNANLTKAGRDRLLRAAKGQQELPVRFHLVGAAAPEIEYIDGVGLLPDLSVDNIGNLDNAVITYTLNIRFKNGVEFTDAVAVP